MLSYILRRLLLIVPTLFGILLINFIIIQAAPGGPVGADDRQAGRLRRRFRRRHRGASPAAAAKSPWPARNTAARKAWTRSW